MDIALLFMIAILVFQAQGSSPKSNLENSRSQSKSSPRKSVSPSKGKKGKKEDRPPSAKKDTKLKKRGEESDEIKTVGKQFFDSN